MKLQYWAIFAVLSVQAMAQESQQNQVFIAQDRNFVTIGYGWNYPIFHSEEDFLPSIGHPILGFNHTTEDWLLGVSVHFKFFEDREDESKLVLWTLEQETYYKLRLYHPLYLLGGTKFLYLYPVQSGRYPFKKRTDLNAEIGVAASIALLYLSSEKFAIVPYADAWRGTGTQLFEGVELGIRLLIPLWF